MAAVVMVVPEAAVAVRVVAEWVRPVVEGLAVRVVAGSRAVLAAEGISAHLVAVVERRASLARLAVAAVGSSVLNMDCALALLSERALALLSVLVLVLRSVGVLVLLSVRVLVLRLARASAVRRCISRAVGCGSSITATSTFLCRLLAPGFGVMILAGGTPIGGGSTATTADTRL